jgi:hypothetical protein
MMGNGEVVMIDHIVHFFDSNFFVGLVTLVVGTVAFRIYNKQKVDAKRDAANVILLEIQSAEQQLQIITQNQTPGALAENFYLMKNSSWDKYRYHFVRDFDRNEWDKITDFYNKCLEYDTATESFNSSWGSNVKNAQAHVLRILADYAQAFVNDLGGAKTAEKKDAIRKKYEAKKAEFISSYGVIQNDQNFDAPYFYNPQKPVIQAKAVLDTIETSLSLTSVGVKLKNMATNPNEWNRLRGRSKK